MSIPALEPRTEIQGVRPQPQGRGRVPGAAVGAGKPFSKVLADQLAPLRVAFSKHALNRLQERRIALSESNLERLNSGVELARQKGSVSTLILMDETAFVVSVNNLKVVTAVTRDAAANNLFTQIDSAAIV